MKRFNYILVLFFLLFNNCGKRLDKIPEEFIGNFYDQSGIEYWTYGLQSNFCITDCQFWDYKKITSNKNKLSLWLKTNGAAKRVDIIKIDSLNFDFVENDKIIHCSRKADSIKRIAKNNPFSMDTGTVVIRGYIKNAAKYFKTDSKIEFIFNNEVIHDTKREYANIDSLGRFDISIKVLHAASFLVKYRNNIEEIFISPGNQLFILTNADNFNDFDFMGAHSDVCYDILSTNEAYWGIESPEQRNSSYAKNPVEFKNYRNLIRQKQDEFLQNYLKNNSCSEAFRIWRSENDQNDYYAELMRYTWNRFGRGSETRMSYKDPYFTFIDSIDLDDSYASIPYRYIFFSGELFNILNYKKGVFIMGGKSKFLLDNWKKELTDKHPEWSEKQINEKMSYLNVDRQINVILSNKYTRYRDLWLTGLLTGIIRSRLYNLIDYTYDRLKTEIRYKPYLNAITEYYNDFKKKEEASKNNPITVMKSSGKGDVLLKEIMQKHKNRVIILDFWFTGCGPCRSDFESMNKFKKDLISEDVDFVYLCYSSIEENWKKVLKEYKVQGDHYLLTNDQFSYFSKMFDINSAPWYILINKQGRVVNSNFRPPMESNGYLSALKNNLLK